MPLSTISPSLVGDNSIADASKQPTGEGIGLKNSYHELFTYNPDTGDLIWKPRPRAHFNTDKGHKAFNTRYAGTVAGNKQVRDNGDPQSINVRLGKLAPGIHRAHRVIVKMVDGSLPDDVLIDHRDGNPWNNRWKNLRRADSADNQYNGQSLPQCARAVGLCIEAHCGKRVLYAAFSFSEPLNELNNGL